jgi:hypothetical protein
MMNLLVQTTKSRRSEDGVSHLEAGYESLGNDIDILKVENVSLKVEIARQGDELDILKVENVGLKVEIARQGNELDILKVENVGLKVEIIRQGNEITRQGNEITRQGNEITRQGDYINEDRREKACKEIAFGVQDVNAKSLLETNYIVKEKGLSEVFKSTRETRNGGAHLLLNTDQGNTVNYKKKAFVRILENANCLEDDLDAVGITRDVIAVVLDVLREELKNVVVPAPKKAEVSTVNKFFKHTLQTMGKICVKEL